MRIVSASWAEDELGPAKVVFLRPCSRVGAVVVIDNVALGPAIGGVRMRRDVGAGEVARLEYRAWGLANGSALSGSIGLPDRVGALIEIRS
jgi:glutamate dehydrogenase (NAD(P)+)